MNSNDDSNGTSISTAPNVGSPGGPAAEGQWVTLRTASFRPSDYGATPGSPTLSIYLGVIANGCVRTWSFVDLVQIVVATNPELGVAKAAGTPTPNGDGTFNVQYSIAMRNTGDVDIDNLQLADDFATQFGSAFTVSNQTVSTGGIITGPVVTSTNGTPIPPTALTTTYDGTGNMFNGTTGLLKPNDEITVTVTVRVDPNAAGAPATFNNTANGSGQDPMNIIIRDDSNNGTDPTSGSGGPGVPTPVTPPVAAPQLGVAKAVGTPSLNADGTFDVQHTIVMRNTGNVDLDNLQLADDLNTQFGSAFTASNQTVTTGGILVGPAVTSTNGTPTLPTPLTAAYDGTGNMFAAATGFLKPNDEITVTFTVRLDPNAASAPSPLQNTATGSGDDPSNTNVTDDSNSGTDPTSGPGGPGTPTTVTPPATNPELGVAKAAGTPSLNADGTFDVQYTIVMRNTGNVDLDNLQLADDLNTQFGSAFTASNQTVTTGGILVGPAVTSTNGTPNPPTPLTAAYDGTGNMFNGTTGLLKPNDEITVTFTVRLDPNAVGAPSPLQNTATGSGDDPSNTNVTDDSNSGTDPTTGPGGPGTPTTVTPPATNPELGVAKAAGTPSLNADGTFDVQYTIVMRNTGNVDLDNLQLADDLNTQFGSAFTASNQTVTTGGILIGPAVTSTNGTPTLPTPLTAAYDGTSNMFNGTTGLLKPNDEITVTFTVRLDPNAVGAPSPLQNTATGSGDDPSNTNVTDDSDSGTDPTTNPGGPGTPTPVTPPATAPQLGVAKTAGVPSLNGDGTFDVVYTIVMRNTGNVDLDNLQLADDLNTQFGSAFTASNQTVTTGGILVGPAVTGTNGTPTLPTPLTAAYDGTSNMFNGTTGLLKPLDEITVTFTVRLDPNAVGAPSPLQNTATGSGDDPSNTNVTDDSNSGTDPTTGPGGPGTPTPVTPPATTPQLGVAKAAGTPSLNADGTFDVQYTIVMRNTGNVDLDNLQLADDLNTQFGSAFTASNQTVTTGGILVGPTVSSTNGTPTLPTPLTASYDGTGNMFAAATGFLKPLDEITVTFTVRLDPNATGAPSPLQNTATGSGDDPSNTNVTDDSNAGTDPTTGPGGPGTPTPVTPPATTPQLGVAKNVGTPSLNADGTFDVQYTIVMRNTGNVDLDNLQLADDLNTQFGSAFTASNQTVTTGGILVGPAVTSTNGTPTLPTPLTAAYDGTSNMFNGTSGLLKPNDEITVTFTVRLDPNAVGAPSPLQNTATGSGDDPSNTNVTDDSNSGTDPTTGSGGPGTPTTVTPPATNPELGVAKSVGTPSLNADGTFDVQYTIVMRNTGNVDLDNLQLADDLNTQFGSAFTASNQTVTTGGILIGPAVTSTNGTPTLPTPLTAAYDGTSNMFNGTTGLLKPNDEITVTFTVRLDPNAVGAPSPLQNTATGSGDDPSNTNVTDDSDSGTDPTNNPGGPGNPTPVTPPSTNPRIALVKTADVSALSTPAQAGDLITYTYVVTNTGDVEVYNVAVTETASQFTGTGTLPAPAYASGGSDLDSGAATATDIRPGETVTFQATYRLTQVDINNGQIENQALAEGTDPANQPVTDISDDSSTANGQDDITLTPLPQTVSLRLTKSLDSVTQVFPYVYDITYTVRVENNGNVTNQRIRVQDDLATALQPGSIVGTPSLTINGFIGNPGVNAGYNGSTNTETLTANPVLAPGQTGTIQIVVRANFTTGFPPVGQGNTAYGSSDQVPGPIPSDDPSVTPGDPSDTNPTPEPIDDTDNDGAPDTNESDTTDRDGDGVPDARDYDPTGYFYCQENGAILPGGRITVTGPTGSQTGVGSSNNIVIVRDGTDGSFQFHVTAPGQYALSYTLPPTGVASTSHLTSGSLDVTSLLPANPGVLGGGEIGNSGQLSDFSPAGNPFYTVFVIEEDDPSVFNNNIPMQHCGTPAITASKQLVSTDVQADGSTRTVFRVGAESTGAAEVRNVTLVDDLDAIFGTGNHVVRGITLISAPPTFTATANTAFNGSSDTNTLTAGGTLRPGEQVVVEITVDISIPADGTYTNIVTAGGASPLDGSAIPSDDANASVGLVSPASLNGLIVKKVSSRQTARIGDVVPYTITITNRDSVAKNGLEFVDLMPAGFTYRPGTATIDGVAVEPVQNGRRLVWSNRSIGPNATVTIRLTLGVGAGADGDEFVNYAFVEDGSGNTISNVAKSVVRREFEHVFDCGEIIGRVFDDKNRDGYQNRGEKGLPGVRVATVRGRLITTDKHGRFHVPCADIPDQRIGSNFIMKVDTRTLPSGYRLTTENPRVVRLTRGKVTKIRFGASISRLVKINLSARAFVGRSNQPVKQLLPAIDKLIQALNRREPSVVRLNYLGRGNRLQAKERLETVSDIIRKRWREVGGPYRLDIEHRILLRRVR